MNGKNIFFIVGAQRSGTTYLYSILDEHPEICMAKPLKPEPKYFLNKTDEIFDEDDYLDKYFSQDTTKTKIYGEKSTSYYENESVAKYISQNLPTAKIIFILADPVSRAISNYKFSVDNNLETRSLKDVFINNSRSNIVNENISVNPFSYKERGLYHKYIDFYYKFFPKENIKIIVRENFTDNLEEIQNLYEFLGCKKDFVPPSINSIINASSKNINIDEEKQVINVLSDFYKEHNTLLEKKYNIDIGNWR